MKKLLFALMSMITLSAALQAECKNGICTLDAKNRTAQQPEGVMAQPALSKSYAAAVTPVNW